MNSLMVVCILDVAYLSSATGTDCFTSTSLGVASTLPARTDDVVRTSESSSTCSDRPRPAAVHQRSSTSSPGAQSDHDLDTAAAGTCTVAAAAGDGKASPRDTTTTAVRPDKPLHPKLVGVGAQLEMKTLWDEFDSLGTEMIVTKAGRYATQQPLSTICRLFNCRILIYGEISFRQIEWPASPFSSQLEMRGKG